MVPQTSNTSPGELESISVSRIHVFNEVLEGDKIPVAMKFQTVCKRLAPPQEGVIVEIARIGPTRSRQIRAAGLSLKSSKILCVARQLGNVAPCPL